MHEANSSSRPLSSKLQGLFIFMGPLMYAALITRHLPSVPGLSVWYLSNASINCSDSAGKGSTNFSSNNTDLMEIW